MLYLKSCLPKSCRLTYPSHSYTCLTYPRPTLGVYSSTYVELETIVKTSTSSIRAFRTLQIWLRCDNINKKHMNHILHHTRT